jgi:uncharacterized protein YggU (UPF0235/DUF167 family)
MIDGLPAGTGDSPCWARRDGDDAVLDLRLQPRAATTGVIEASAQCLRVRVQQAAVDNAANQALTRFVAREFRIPAKPVRLLSGARIREKRVRIEAPRRLPAWLSVR